MFDFLNRTKLYSRNRQYHRCPLLGFPIVYSIWRTQKRSKQNFRSPLSPHHFYKKTVWRNEALYRKVITCFILVPWTSLLSASQVNCEAQTSQVYQMFLHRYHGLTEVAAMVPANSFSSWILQCFCTISRRLDVLVRWMSFTWQEENKTEDPSNPSSSCCSKVKNK